MSIDAGELAQSMLSAMKGVLSEKWPEIKEYAESEAKKLAESFVAIQTLKSAGKIDEEEAALHFSIQKNASRTVLLTIKGLSTLAAEQAINAALDVVKDTVNTAVGFTLI
ncbi:hypothetical protein [Pseudoalteromonas byunsanensis]|uniref:Uncharacterized protein n=1 Tax=Pseudoalteromonas byunsanensis TaxID=327939 RepID=A0A1S1N243_9GAMM|nr:hypothetical protein [Pseudoalteromonas byunsanensis]OHU93524.1 hypothetical protein BIW53_19435 [Pseudoalteromonas byunsanensis]